MPESPRSSSCISSPYSTLFIAGAAVAFDRCPVEAEFAHWPNQLARKAAVAVALFNDGDEVVLDEGARVVADEEFILGKKSVKLKKINALKLECHRSPF